MLGALPAIGSRTSINSADLHNNFLIPAESTIDSKLAKLYTLPITTECQCGHTCNVPILQTIATDLAIYRVLSQRIFTQEKKNESLWPDKFKEAMDSLDAISSGEMELVTDANEIVNERTDLASVETSSENYNPTMTEDDPILQTDDSDKIDDIRQDRDIYI